MTQVYTVAQIASLLCVSPATIHNWIKAGHLVKAAPEACAGLAKASSKNAVTAESVAAFQQNILGTSKLNKRANKQYRKGHNHAALSATFLAKVWDNIHDPSHGDALSIAYEQALSNQYKNTEGVYYTPPALCTDMLAHLPQAITPQLDSAISSARPAGPRLFCDPCCGSGNFLLAALEQGFAPQHIYGYDIDPVAVAISQRRLFDRTGLRSTTIYCADFGEECAEQRVTEGFFDCIMTNPPWGKKLLRAPRQVCQLWATKAGLRRPIDSSGFFWLLACSAVKEGGYIGLLVQEAFFQVRHFEELREHVLQKQLICCIDYGKPFTTLISKANAIIVRNSPANAEHDNVQCCNAQGQSVRTTKSFRANPRTMYNISATAHEQAVLSHMRALPHITLGQGVRWGLGIVTGNNKAWLRDSPAQGYMPVLKGSDIQKKGIKAPSCYIPTDLSLYQQVAAPALYTAPAKILYRFISTNLVFFYDTEQRFMLNSANMLITPPSFPIAMPTLTDFLNTRIINWFYKKLFETHKVLRSNIEYLPIYADFLQTQGKGKQEEGCSEDKLLDYLGIIALPCGGYRLRE